MKVFVCVVALLVIVVAVSADDGSIPEEIKELILQKHWQLAANQESCLDRKRDADDETPPGEDPGNGEGNGEGI